MKLALDFFPILLFFVGYKFGGIYVATGIAIGASVLQMAYAKFVLKRIEIMHWVSFGTILIFGSLTLILHNPTFVKWKPTVLYWAMGISLLVSTVFFKRNLIGKMVNDQLQLPDAVWRRLNFAWIAFFITMGGLNLVIAYNFSEEVWVNFKLFGSFGLIFLFIIVQGFFLAPYLKDDQVS